MARRTIIILVSISALVVAAGLGVLIWWLLWPEEIEITTQVLEGAGIGSAEYTAGFTRFGGVGSLFWWFYPTVSNDTRPLLLWLDGVTGVPPSSLANLGMFGPYDHNLNERTDSWVDEFNLLFVDAPIGTGFSVAEDASRLPRSLDENAEHLVATVRSFYETHPGHRSSPLHIVGQGSGAQLALALAERLWNEEIEHNLRGIILANPIVSPALAMTRLGFYLEELGYIDDRGRSSLENLSNETNTLVNEERYGEAFDRFLSLGTYVNEAGAEAVNMGRIVDKLTRESSTLTRVPKYFGVNNYLSSLFAEDLFSIMDQTVANSLGISTDTPYDAGREAAVQSVRDTFMIPVVDKVEHILQRTNLNVAIYNGNLDAVSNTPGQLEWVNDLNWYGQEAFRSRPRQTLAVNRIIEGYYRETSRLQFYWMNAAGHWVPIDSPAAMKRVFQRITEDR